MDRLHGGVKAHGPTPEQGCAFRRRTAIDNLLNLTFTAIPADRQDGGTVHSKQQHRSVQEDDRQRMEWVVEQIAMAQ